MIRRFAIALAAAAAALSLSAPAPAQGFGGEPMVDASIIAERDGVAPGGEITVALRQEIPEGWHTYWRNPGDSGEPTRIRFDLPEGWSAGEIEWPAPQAYPLGPLVNYGYSDEVVLPVVLGVPDDAEPGRVEIPVQASWLVCEEICIPEEGAFTLALDVSPDGGAENARAARRIAEARAAVPEREADLSAGLVLRDGRLVLTAAGPALAGEIRNVAFFPHEGGLIEHAAEQRASFGEAALSLSLEPGFMLEDTVEAVHPGVLAFETRASGRWTRRALLVEPEPGVEAAEIAPAASDAGAGTGAAADAGGTAATPPQPAAAGFLQAAVLALLGGLVLNLMPCVFPVLSMKALTLVEKRGAARAEARVIGVLFGAGVILTFLALGGLLLALRALGLPDLWGFQLQAPLVNAGLAALMFLIGLNLIGAFEVGTSLQSVGGSVSGSGRLGGFLTGVLAVFVAAPCLAPFMTGALAFAFTQPPAASLVIFGFLGVGLAAPFVLVAFSPRLLGVLPKPGAWMTRFRQLLAFPMFATALWLVWVLTVQTGPEGALWSLALLLAIAFVVWAFQGGRTLGRAAGAAGLVAAVLVTLSIARLDPAEAAETASGDYEPWSVARVEALQAEGRAVFVDFTAAWCVTCQVNKLTVLSDDRVEQAFAAHEVALLRADFTNRDPEIAAELARRGSAGVPLYLLFPADGGAPQILPPVLTRERVIRAVEAAV